MSNIQISWKRQKFHLDYTEPILATTTLAYLKQQCSEITGVPVDSMKLSLTGAIFFLFPSVMKDDSATLASYGLRPGSKVTLVGEKTDDTLSESSSYEESRLVQQIQRLLEKTRREIAPKLEELELDAAKYAANRGPTNIKERGNLVNLRNHLNEQLMQALFALDGVVFSSEYERARKIRRAAVKETQKLLDRLDGVMPKLNDLKERM